jgi:hypothetical protein
MSLNLEELQKWFPSGTAEGERSILEKVFVYVTEFNRVLSPQTGSPYLLIGRKGSGKSAILDFAVKILELQRVPAIVLRPSDISTSSLTDQDSIGELIRQFKPILLSAIASKIAEQQEGVLIGDHATLYNEAIRAGHRSPDFVGKMARLLPKIAKPLLKIDLTPVLPDLNSVTLKELERAISNRVSEKRFHLFIDDTDQVANPDKAGHLNRIWGLMLAVRELTSNISELRAVITLRSEVWERLKRESSGQRDQTDHFTNLEIRLSSSDKHVQEIVETRLRLAAKNCPVDKGPYASFFDGSTARAPNSDEQRSWHDLIFVRSRQGPRDAIQLINNLAGFAMYTKKVDKINEEVFRAVMPIFSENRARLFGQEFEFECSKAVDILRSFAQLKYPDGGFRLKAEPVKDHLIGLPSQFGINLYGRTIQPGNEDDVFDLWRFLYMANVLNARVSDIGEKDGFKHLVSEDDPFLVSKPRWNEMQKMLWEISPVYRDFLLKHQSALNAMTGLPIRNSKHQKSRRRPNSF